MKKLISIFLLLFSLNSFGATSSQITLTLTVTNIPAGHDTLVVNANTRTWTNSATASPSTLILIGASIGASATNLWNQLAGTRYAGPIDLVSFSSSNVITLRGQCGNALAASISGTWASLSLATNVCTNLTVVRVPIDSEPTPSTGTNIASLLVNGISSHSTASFTAGSTAIRNTVQTTTAQDVDGVKTFLAPIFANSAIVITNAANATFNIYDPDYGLNDKWFQIGYEEAGVSFSFINDDGSVGSVFMSATKSGGVADVVAFGAPINAASLMNCVVTNSAVQNSSLRLTNTVTGNWRWERANHTALANGNNAGVDFNTNIFVKIKAGPSAAFAICGIVGGANGRELKIYNSVAQNMTIANDSGVEPVAANRIYTLTGSDIATTGIGYVHLIYDSEDSRWIVQNYQP